MADEPVRGEVLEDGREGIDEDDLDVEDDEGHGHQVELHREPIGRLDLGDDAALVRCFLRPRWAASAPRMTDARKLRAANRNTSASIEKSGRYWSRATCAGYPRRAGSRQCEEGDVQSDRPQRGLP
jgi:hypothetical protein